MTRSEDIGCGGDYVMCGCSGVEEEEKRRILMFLKLLESL